MQYYVPPVAKLIEQFEKLPGVGHKTAQRLAFHVIGLPRQSALDFAAAIVDNRVVHGQLP